MSERGRVLKAWAHRKTRPGDVVQAGSVAYRVEFVEWIDTTSSPKRARVGLRPTSRRAKGQIVELCDCVACANENGPCRVRGGPDWETSMAYAGSVRQGPALAAREQRRRDKGWST